MHETVNKRFISVSVMTGRRIGRGIRDAQLAILFAHETCTGKFLKRWERKTANFCPDCKYGFNEFLGIEHPRNFGIGHSKQLPSVCQGKKQNIC